jgi:hypothetical protein
MGLEEVLDFSRHRDVKVLMVYRDRERDAGPVGHPHRRRSMSTQIGVVPNADSAGGVALWVRVSRPHIISSVSERVHAFSASPTEAEMTPHRG